MRKFKGLWWINPIKTEEYLNILSNEGYNLCSISSLGILDFTASNIKREYKITYNQFINNKLPKPVDDSGWEISLSTGKYKILSKDKSKLSKYSIDRNSIIDRLSLIRKIFSIIYILYLSFTILPLLIFLPIMFVSTEVTYAPFWWIGPLVTILLHCSAIRFLVSISKGIRALNKDCNISTINLDYTNDENNCSISKSKLVKKLKLAWFYSPDKMEEYLQNMELKGFNLVKINKVGNMFYFRVGEKRKIRYCVDYTFKVNPQYFEMHKTDNWTLCFHTSDMIGSIVIWSKEFENDSEELNIFSDKESMLKRAKRSLIIYSSLIIPIICFSFMLFTFLFTDIEILPFTLFVYIIGLIEFIIFYGRVILYYLRVKKLYK